VRTTSERVPLVSRQFAVTGTGTQQLTLQLDLASCLADAQHAGATGCSLAADIELRDAQGATIDSTSVGSLLAEAGKPVDASVTLREATTVSIVSGDDQVGVAGQDALLPVGVKVTD